MTASERDLGLGSEAASEEDETLSEGPLLLADHDVSAEMHQYVCVGIPAYNAENTVGRVVEQASRFADLVLVVDDGSKDATAVRAREAGATVVSHRRNRGYGGALQTIFKEAVNHDVDYLITFDADEQHDPATIPKLVEVQNRTGADVVIASRYVAGSETELPLIRSVGLSVVNLLTNWSMGRYPPRSWIKDTQSGLRAYSSEAIESLAMADEIGDGMWASTDIIYHINREKFSVLEVGTTVRYDVEHGSTEGALTHGANLVRNIFRFSQRTHPLLLLGVPGGICVVVGVILGIWVLELLLLPTLLTISTVALAVAASLSILFGISIIFLAVLLHMINIHPYFNK